MTDDDKYYSIGFLAFLVKDLCDNHEEQLAKSEFVNIARATANLLLASSGADEPLLDARDDEFTKENADQILDLWKVLGK